MWKIVKNDNDESSQSQRRRQERNQQQTSLCITSNTLLFISIMIILLSWSTVVVTATTTENDDIENNNDSNRRYLRESNNNNNVQLTGNMFEDDERSRAAKITRVWDICPGKGFPALHAIIHERDPKLKADYERVMGDKIYRFNGGKYGIHHDEIPIRTITESGSKFALLRENEQEYYWTGQGSVWNDKSGEVIRTLSHNHDSGKPMGALVPPLKDEWEKSRKVINLEGDYVAYTGWMYGNLGHFMHDNLPSIAYLKSIVPETTKFLLGYNELHERILKFIDEDFVEKRVKWIDTTGHHIYQVSGSMTATLWDSPMYYGCCSQFEPLRQWIETTHISNPYKPPDKKYIIFYTRSSKDGMAKNQDNKHGRIVDPALEKQLLEILRSKMKEYGRQDKLVIFDGQENGKTMSIERQYAIFRSASVIIGPHGSGLGGNYIWTYPNPRTCDERVRVLEFLPGEESKHVQGLHSGYFMHYRKWPFEYHQIMYTKDSTPMVTQIDINNYKDALDAMLNENGARIKTVDFINGSTWTPQDISMKTYIQQVEDAKKKNIDRRIISSAVQ